MMTPDEAKAALALAIPKNDADAADVRGYLKELLTSLLIEEESFSGKRPFGNSGWQYDILTPLHEAGFCSEGPQHEERVTLFDGLVGAL